MNREEALHASDEALQELAAQLRQGKSDQLVRYLDLLSQFHGYSFGNVMLIAPQRPGARMVAGFHRWRQLGRFVKKGEKGIAILAPLVGRRTNRSAEEDPPQLANIAMDEGRETPKTKVVFGFRVVFVFDVSQTDGTELPQFASVQADPGHKLSLLLQLVCEEGIELEFRPQLPGGALGMSSGGKIVIASSLDPPRMFATLVHELAHEKLHWGERRTATTTRIRETEAEAVAYVVCRAMGLDCSTQFSDYIQLYRGDEKTLLESLEFIRNVASRIIGQLENLSHAEQSASEVA